MVIRGWNDKDMNQQALTYGTVAHQLPLIREWCHQQSRVPECPERRRTKGNERQNGGKCVCANLTIALMTILLRLHNKGGFAANLCHFNHKIKWMWWWSEWRLCVLCHRGEKIGRDHQRYYSTETQFAVGPHRRNEDFTSAKQFKQKFADNNSKCRFVVSIISLIWPKKEWGDDSDAKGGFDCHNKLTRLNHSFFGKIHGGKNLRVTSQLLHQL